jgi:molybdopterin-guanine dinucleotide biosynthesis protein A
VVLAGGESRRFGSNKALALLGGRRLVDRVLNALAAVCDEVIVVGGDPLPDLEARHVRDEVPGQGPLGGLVTAFRSTGAPSVLLAGCDLPLVHPDLLRALVTRAAGWDAVVPVSGGHLHALCALYARSCISLAEDALARGERRMHIFLAGVRALRLPAGELPHPESLANVNTPRDLAELEMRWRSRVPGGSWG